MARNVAGSESDAMREFVLRNPDTDLARAMNAAGQAYVTITRVGEAAASRGGRGSTWATSSPTATAPAAPAVGAAAPVVAALTEAIAVPTADFFSVVRASDGFWQLVPAQGATQAAAEDEDRAHVDPGDGPVSALSAPALGTVGVPTAGGGDRGSSVGLGGLASSSLVARATFPVSAGLDAVWTVVVSQGGPYAEVMHNDDLVRIIASFDFESHPHAQALAAAHGAAAQLVASEELRRELSYGDDYGTHLLAESTVCFAYRVLASHLAPTIAQRHAGELRPVFRRWVSGPDGELEATLTIGAIVVADDLTHFHGRLQNVVDELEGDEMPGLEYVDEPFGIMPALDIVYDLPMDLD